MIFFKAFILTICLVNSTAYSIPLKNIILKEGMRIAVYPGSFDPFHKAHMAIIDEALKLDSVDYVIVYAEQEFKPSKPNRTYYPIRQKMLESVYHDHPQVLLSTERLVDIIKMLRDHKVTVIALVGADNISPETIMFVADKWIVNLRPGFREDKNILEMTDIMGQPVTKIMAKDGEVSSTKIRQLLIQSLTEASKEAPRTLPVAGPVEKIIHEKGLYH